MLDQWFSYRRRDRTKPLIGDKRPPSPLEKIQPDGWLAEYTEDLLNLLNVLGRLIALEPRQADLLDRIVAGPLVAIAGEERVGDNGRRAVAIARVLWQTRPTDSLARRARAARHDRAPCNWTCSAKASRSFGASKCRPGCIGADPDEVRAELLRVLAKVRAAQTFPWDARRTLYWRTVFPQMTNWLPDEEAAQLRFEFETEIRRLEAA